MTSNVNSGSSCTRFEYREIDFSWRIENLSLCNKNHKELLESQIFPKLEDDKCEWRLWFYPFGVDDDSKNHFSIFLKFIPGSHKRAKANYTISIRNENGKLIKSQKFSSVSFSNNRMSWGVIKFAKSNEVTSNLEHDVLVINCLLNWVTDVNTVKIYGNEALASLDVHRNLCNDLNQLAEKGSFSDVKLLVNDGTIFSAHKCMLAARSPVFAAMFAHSMKERLESYVKILDVSADILKSLLQFIYTAQFDKNKYEMEELLAAADRYDVKDLKLLCEEELSKRIAVENAADLLLLADQYNSEILKERLLEFIKTNLKAVMKTNSMDNLLSVRSYLSYEILKAQVN